MATSNFARPQNASKYFVVLTNREENYKECNNCDHKHYAYDYNLEPLLKCMICDDYTLGDIETETQAPHDFEYDDLKDDLGYELEQIGGTSLDEAIGHDNSYHRQAIGSISSDKYFGDINVELEIKVLVQSAYYEGATLDYLISIYNGSEYTEVEDGYYTTTVEDIIEDLFETKYDSHDYSTMNKGMRTIQSRNAIDWVQNEIEELSSKVEKILETYSQHKLACKGVFSNGEAIYTKVD